MGELLVRYEESGIDERILRAVEEMGFVHMTPIQEKAIPVFLEGRDVIGQALRHFAGQNQRSRACFCGCRAAHRPLGGQSPHRQDRRVWNPDASED